MDEKVISNIVKAFNAQNYSEVYKNTKNIKNISKEYMIIVLSLRAWSLHKLGKDKKSAIIDLENAVRHMKTHKSGFSPEHMPLQYLMELYCLTEEYDKAKLTAMHILNYDMQSYFAWEVIGLVHFIFAEYYSAIDAFKQCLHIAKNKQEKLKVNYNLALIKLALGDYEQGLKNYESRFDLFPIVHLKGLESKKWQGESLDNKTILVFTEQGLGDTLFYCRYFFEVQEQSKNLIIVLQDSHTPVLELMKKIFDTASIYLMSDIKPTDITFDYHVAMMSLPYYLGVSNKEFCNSHPYININSENTTLINNKSGLKIGLCWYSHHIGIENNKQEINIALLLKERKRMSIEQFSCFLQNTHNVFYSLQIQHTESELTIMKQYDIFDLSKQQSNFSDTAKIIYELDLVITIDTAVAHLAAAMGKPTWILLPLSSDWRWQVNRDDSPWYSSVRLFRQSKFDSWEDVINRVALALSEFNK